MSELTALIFDVDGTLADTEATGHRVAFNKAFAEAGLNWHWSVDLYGKLLAVTGGKERILHYIQNYHPEFTAPGALDEFIAGLHRAKNGYYADMVVAGEIPLRPGVKRLLQEAQQAGLHLAIATTTSLENVEALLEHSLDPDAASWFEVIAAGDMVAAKKPAPDIYHYTLDALQLSPAQCLAVEDSTNGLRSALAADLRTLVTVSDYTRDERFDGALLVVDQLGEPGHAMKVLAGDAYGAAIIDVDTLRRVFGGEELRVAEQG
ncbi:MAG: HAD family hydrolase [Gammaproteobacteria bacterium]|jgi:HAD superfamily hydrolase (TIGR01509 family)